MTGRELLLRAVKNEVTPRPAWVPFVGCHGGKLVGQDAASYLQSADHICAGLLKARDLYKPDGLPVAFDLQLEAEVLGCELRWASETPPAVVSHPLEHGAQLQDLPSFDPSKGRFPAVLETLDRLKPEFADEVALYGLVCGPFTLALHLMGNNIFLQMFDNPDYVKAVIGFCAVSAQKAALAYLDHQADVIAVVDPMTSQISPAHFTEFVTPYINQVFDAVRERGGLSSLFVCGDASRNLDIMSQSRCDNISIDENIPLENLRDITRSGKKSFGGNLKLTSVLLLGTPDDARLDAIRCIDLGGGCGFILAPGCDLPYHVPPENLQAVAEMVHDRYHREVAKRTIIASSTTKAKADLPTDFNTEPNVRLDIVTLDSASCAPCQYMVDAVRRCVARVSHPVIVKEHRITTREGLAAMEQLGVQNIPTICIDGQVAFASIIPDQNTLLAELEKHLARKTS